MQPDTESPQSAFLDVARRDSTPVRIFLVNGMRLTGLIEAFDNYAILLDTPGGKKLLLKHVIATVLPDTEALRGRRTEGEGRRGTTRRVFVRARAADGDDEKQT